MTQPKALAGCQVMPPLKPAAPSGAGKAPRSLGTQSDRGQGQAKGRWQDLNAFVDGTMRHIDGTSAKVWFALFRDARSNGIAKASNADLARRTGMSVRSVFNARRRLLGLGLIELVRRGSLATGASVYRVFALIPATHCRLQPAKPRRKPGQPVA